jgi:hypothetical protein
MTPQEKLSEKWLTVMNDWIESGDAGEDTSSVTTLREFAAWVDQHDYPREFKAGIVGALQAYCLYALQTEVEL